MRKRRPVKLMLMCMLLGAIINVLVAWGLAISPDDAEWRIEENCHQQLRHLIERHDLKQFKNAANCFPTIQTGTGCETCSLIATDSLTPGTRYVHSTPLVADEVIEFSAVAGGIPEGFGLQMLSRRCVGWPCRAFQTVAILYGDSAKDQIFYATEPRPFHIGSFDFGTHRLPYGPLWSGLIVNTIFYAAIMWLLVRGPWETRRRWRELRGRCGICSYLRGESSVCTECGGDLTRSWGRASSV
jgi:hypothetical protein